MVKTKISNSLRVWRWNRGKKCRLYEIRTCLCAFHEVCEKNVTECIYSILRIFFAFLPLFVRGARIENLSNETRTVDKVPFPYRLL